MHCKASACRISKYVLAPLLLFFFFPFSPPVCIQAASSHAAVSMAISICVRNSLTLSHRSFHAEIPRRIQIGAERGDTTPLFFDKMQLFLKSSRIFGACRRKRSLRWCWQPLFLCHEGDCGLLHRALTFELKKNGSEGNLNRN